MRNIYFDKNAAGRGFNAWRVQFGVKGKNIYIGCFKTQELAVVARDKWIAENGSPKMGRPWAKVDDK